jgi:GntR family transcriptional regulator
MNKKLLIAPLSAARPEPLYLQIIDGIRREISSGRLAPNDPLPSFRELAEDLLVSLVTVKRAYEELERSGIIYRKQGLGTFVAEQGVTRSRQVDVERIADLFQLAIKECRKVGLDEEQIQALVQQALQQR